MAAIGNKYDQNAAPATGRDTMPEHECTAQIIESDYKTTKSGNGHYIMLVWAILDGPHKGRQLYDNLNVDNPSKIAADIGNAAFAAIRIALFCTKDKVVQDTAELHSIPCRIKVGIQTDKKTKETSNTIKKYSSLNTPASQPAAASTAPWQSPAATAAPENF